MADYIMTVGFIAEQKYTDHVNIKTGPVTWDSLTFILQLPEGCKT
jgi:hypothetical protein